MPFTNCNVFILTGEIHCGKSRALGRLLDDLKQRGKTIGGLLNPSIDSEKWFVNLSTDDIFSAEKMNGADKPLKVGKYVFSHKAFEKAKSIITGEIEEPCDYFVIDELGKLELTGQGLEPAISNFIKTLPSKEIENLIIVVRDYLVEEAKSKFDLDSATIIKHTDLNPAKWA